MYFRVIKSFKNLCLFYKIIRSNIKSIKLKQRNKLSIGIFNLLIKYLNRVQILIIVIIMLYSKQG